MTRTQNSFFNLIASFGSMALLLILNFITRSVFIRTLGTSFLGIEGLFSSVLSMLSLAELGFGAAIVYKLYKPIEEKDHLRIQVLMKFYRRVYQVIGIVILVLGLCLIPILPHLVKDYERMADLGLNAIVVFLMYLFNSVSSYWFFAYKSTFVEATQKSYLLIVVGYLISIGGAVAQILVLYLLQNFLAYLAVQILFSILRNLVYAIVCDKRYPFIREKTPETLPKEEQRQLFRDCYALFLHRINNVILSASDNLIISSMIGLDGMGLYANYLSIKVSLQNLLYTFTTSIHASLGSLYTTGNLNWSRLIFRTVNFITFWLYGLAAIGLAILMDDFIAQCWIGSQFVVTSWTHDGVTIGTPLALLVAIEVYIVGQENYCGSFRNAMGLFQPLKYRPIASIAVNLAVGILTVPYLGLAGCVLGTIVSGLTTNLIIDPIIIHKHALKTSVRPYFLRNLLYKIVVIAAGFLSWWLCSLVPLAGIPGFLVHGILCVTVSSGLFLLCFFRTEEFRYLLNTVKSLLSNRLST